MTYSASDFVSDVAQALQDASLLGPDMADDMTMQELAALVVQTILESNKNDTESADQDTCAHEWAYSGSAYGGDDDRYFGEGRCYCVKCGADGDG